MLTIICFLQQITCTYDTNMCQAPCSICLYKKEDLSSMGLNKVVCIKDSMKKMYQIMTSTTAPRNEAKALSKASSLHPIPISSNSN